MLRDQTRAEDWSKGYGNGPLAVALAEYRTAVAQVGPWSVWRHGLPVAPS